MKLGCATVGVSGWLDGSPPSGSTWTGGAVVEGTTVEVVATGPTVTDRPNEFAFVGYRLP